MALIIDGKPTTLIPDGDKVVDDITFTPGFNKNTKKFKKKPQGMVLHWTGAENPARRVKQTLINRKLSIHFTIEKDGTIVQMADLTTRCAHAGIANGFIGVEIVSRGFASREDMKGQKGLRDRTDIDWEEGRDVFKDVIAGKKINLATYYPEQVDSVVWLCETLAGILLFPRLIPYEIAPGWGDERMKQIAIRTTDGYAVPLFNRDTRGRWSPRGKGRALTFNGVIGHFHVHKQKLDPGTQLFYALWAEGWNPLGKKLFNWKELIA